MVTPEQTAVAATAAQAASLRPRPSLGALWIALDRVPDPEVPVLSVIDLGMVRGIEWNAADPSQIVVKLTPTYSGCPATDVITAAIREALLAAGAAAVRVDVELSPAWTTDWLTASGERKLRDYGIAPPHAARTRTDGVTTIDVGALRHSRRKTTQVTCPRCGSLRTELVSQFGSTPCKALYRCTACLEPFDHFKPH